MRTISFAATCAVLVSAAAEHAFADSTNMLEIRAGEAIELDTGSYVDLSNGGAIEFWYRHQSDRASLTRFAQFLDDAYSIVLSVGNRENLSFAVVIGPGVRGTASLGIVKDLGVFGNAEELNKSLVRFERRDDLGNTDPIELVNTELYHFLLAQRAGTDEVRVFLNGTYHGSVRASFGTTAGLPLSLGWKADPPAGRGESSAGSGASPSIYPFKGFLGGLRAWKTGDFEDKDALRLSRFGRSPDRVELPALPRYADLVAYGDFMGRPRLRFTDPLAGAWYDGGTAVTQTRANASIFDDYPVYTFVPATDTALPPRLEDRKYHVFEDSNWIGELRSARPGPPETWEFRHADPDWPPLEVVHLEAQHTVDDQSWDSWDLRWILPPGKRLGRATPGAVTLTRRTTVEMGISSLSERNLAPSEQKELKAQNDAISLVFLYTAYPKFFTSLYRGYNIVEMDPWDFFTDGTKAKETALFAPTADQHFHLDKAHQLILPYDLGVLHSPLAMESSTSRLVTSASEYNSAVTNRIGAGISGSATIGTGAQSPISASLTVNMHVVVQGTTVRELSGQSSAQSEKILRSKWKKDYALYHRKDVTRLSKPYVAALKALWEESSTANAVDRRRLVYAFFDHWGTHYPFAAVFGSLEFTETTVDEKMRMVALSETGSFELSVNDGKTGQEQLKKEGNTESVKVGSTVSRYVGDDNQKTLIALDLRPLHDLLTPQHFPNEPNIYVELRSLLGHGLQAYRTDRIGGIANELSGAERSNAEHVIKDLLTPPAAAAPRINTLAVRYEGVSLSMPFVPEPFAKAMAQHPIVLDGEIGFWPEVVPPDFLPASLKESAEGFQRRLDRPGPVAVVDRRRPTERPRAIKPNGEVQAFGEPLATSIELKLPRNEPMLDFTAIMVRARFWSETDEPFKRGGETFRLPRKVPYVLRPGHEATLSGGSYGLGHALVWEIYEQKWGADEGSLLMDKGFPLWATSAPVVLQPTQGRIDVLNGWAPPGRQKFFANAAIRLEKAMKDTNGELNVFQTGEWKSVSAPMVIRATDKANKTVPFFEARVHVKYTLLEDFKDVLKREQKRLMPDATWGTFYPGANTPEWSPYASRSTANLRFPPSKPIAGMLVDRLGARADVPISLHVLGPIVRDEKRYEGRDFLVSRGGGAIECWFWGYSRGDQREAVPEWAFIERQPGEWWIACTKDGRVLAADGASVAARVPAAGDEKQLWIPSEARYGAETVYRFRNKWTGTYLSSVFTKGSSFDAKLSLIPEQDAPFVELPGGKYRSVTFWTKPPVDLRPYSQLKAIDAATPSLAAAELSAAVAAVRKPLPEYGHATFHGSLWSEIAATFDANRSGTLEPNETGSEDFGRFIGGFISTERFPEAPGGVTPATFEEWATRNLGTMEKATSAAQLADHVAGALAQARQWRLRNAIGRFVAAFDANRDGEIDGTESSPFLARLETALTLGALGFEEIDAVQGAKDGKLSSSEVQAAIAAAQRRGPAPRTNVSPAAAGDELRAAIAALRNPLPRFGEASFSDELAKEVTASRDADGNGRLESAELPNGGTFTEYLARIDRSLVQMKESVGPAEVRRIMDLELLNLRKLRIERSIEQLFASLDFDKSGGLDPAESSSLFANLSRFPSLSNLDFAAIDRQAGAADGKLSTEEVQTAVLDALAPELEPPSAPAAAAPAPTRAPSRPQPAPARPRLDENELPQMAQRFVIMVQSWRADGQSDEQIARGLSEFLERIHVGLDANSDGGLDAAESRGLLSALAAGFKGEGASMDFKVADAGAGADKTGAGDGKLSAAELAGAVLSLSR